MFHRDISQCSDLNPANRLCRIGRHHRQHPVHTRHATTRGRLAVCVGVFAALGACSGPVDEPGATEVASDGAVTVTVVMKDMRFEPSVIAVEPGTHVIIEAKNSDSMPHDLVF